MLVHLVANPHDDVFRDELYFIVCGLRPAFGYVDQPPLIPLIAAACAYATPYENGLTIWVLRSPRAQLADIWPSLKHYD